jgi:hypothetical protein
VYSKNLRAIVRTGERPTMLERSRVQGQ